MTRKKTGRRISGDPRKSGGDIAGWGGPNDANAVVIDATNAVLLDQSTVTLVGSPGNPAPYLAVLLEGRINKTPERARNLYLMNEDGAAALVTELIALAHRIGPAFGARFMERLEHLLDTDGFTGVREEDDHA